MMPAPPVPASQVDVVAWLAALQAGGGDGPALVAQLVRDARAQGRSMRDLLAEHGLTTQAPVQVPSAAGALPSSLRLVSDPFHPEAQQILALRVALMASAGGGDSQQALAVVSGDSGDGRSTLAASLAVAFSQLEQPTLLVDADFSAPSQAGRFGLNAVPGLSDFLDRGVPISPVPIQGAPHLWVMTSGAATSQASALLSTHLFREALAGWRGRFRHVIVDTAAISRGADALLAARAAGRALVMARTHNSRLRNTSLLLQRLANAGVPLAGSVLVEPRT